MKKEFTLPEGITLNDNEQAIVDALMAEFAAISETIAGLSPSEGEGEGEAAITEEDIEKALKAFKVNLDDDEKFKALQTAMQDQGLLIKALQENTATPARRKTLGQQFKEYCIKNPEAIENVKKSQGHFVLNLKTAATILNSTHVTGTVPQAEREPGLTDVAVERSFIMDVVGVSPTSSKTIDYIQKANQDGTVAFVADTAGFANIDFDMVVTSSAAKDLGGYITVHENMLDDIDFLAGEIDKELMYQIRAAADASVLAGDGTSNTLTGITASAAAFSLATVQVVTPTYWDAIAAAITQVRVTGFDEANMIVMHPADYANALAAKGSDGHYNGHPLLSVDGKTFSGIPIYLTTFITAGQLLVGNKMHSNIKILQDIELAIGYNLTGEFVKRHITVRGGMRLNHYIKSNYNNSFVYDAIDDIITAITAV